MEKRMKGFELPDRIKVEIERGKEFRIENLHAKIVTPKIRDASKTTQQGATS